MKKFLDQDFSGAALDEFKREVRTYFCGFSCKFQMSDTVERLIY